MTWNHRVVALKEGGFQFAEVYYTDEGKPNGFSDICSYGDTVQELEWITEKLKAALAQPVLREEEL